MWNSNKSRLLIVRLSFGGIKRVIIPVPLFVLDITFDAIADLAILADLLFALCRKSLYREIYDDPGPRKNHGFQVPISVLVKECLGLFDEMRRHGRWQMVRVEAGDVSVAINFW